MRACVPRLVLIFQTAGPTVRQHDQRCHPTPLAYESSLGPDYHPLSDSSSVFTLRPPLTRRPLFSSSSSTSSLPPSPLSIFLHTHTKKREKRTDVKCTRATRSISDQIRASCVGAGGVHIREILQTSACPVRPHHLDPCVTVKGCGEGGGEGNTRRSAAQPGLFCCQKGPD